MTGHYCLQPTPDEACLLFTNCLNIPPHGVDVVTSAVQVDAMFETVSTEFSTTQAQIGGILRT
jgi:hypothetical protein